MRSRSFCPIYQVILVPGGRKLFLQMHTMVSLRHSILPSPSFQGIGWWFVIVSRTPLSRGSRAHVDGVRNSKNGGVVRFGEYSM
jgi:acyl-CoA thioesterase